MSTHTLTSREFNRNVPAAKRAAVDGPVFITEHGRPAFAFLQIDDYYRLIGQNAPTLLEVMDGIPGGNSIEFDPPKLATQFPDASFD